MAFPGSFGEVRQAMGGAARDARARIAALPRQFRGLGRPMKLRIGAGVVALALVGGTLLLHGEARSMPHRSLARVSVGSPAAVPRAAHVAARAAAQESHGDFKSDAQRYADASRRGDSRSFQKLVAMTRSPQCDARSQAADALGGVRSGKSTAALRRLASANFADEPRSPGLFSCSSRRAARKALESR
jgi:general stress protein YciG